MNRMACRAAFLSFLGLCLALISSGCGFSSIRAGAQPIRIAYSHQGFETESWVFMHDTLQRLSRELDFQLEVRNAEEDVDRQLADVNDLIASGIDGIVLAPQDGDSAVGLIALCNREDVPVGILNRPPANLNGRAILGATDNYGIARGTTDYLVSELLRLNSGKPALILVGDLNDINAIERRRGFLDALEARTESLPPAIQVATEWDAIIAAENLEAALDRNPDIGMIFTSSDFLYPVIERTLAAHGMWHPRGESGHVVLGGIDGDTTAGRLMDEGYVDATGVQVLDQEVTRIVTELLAAIRRGDPQPDRRDRLEGLVLTQDNMKDRRGDMWGNMIRSSKDEGQKGNGQ